MQDWRSRSDLWNGVAVVRRWDDSTRAEAGEEFVACFVEATSREEGADLLFKALASKGWQLLRFLNFQSAQNIDDEAAEYLEAMATEAEAVGFALGKLPDDKALAQ